MTASDAVLAPMSTHTPQPAASLLDARGVAVHLGATTVLHGVDITVAAGEVVAVIGPNGAGKSTLLRAIAGLLPLDGGTVRLGGQPLDVLSRRDRARFVALVPQLPEAPSGLTVEALALLGRHPHLPLLGHETRRDYDIAYTAMRAAGCADLAERPLGTLSGGQRRRAFIARALAQQPRLLLLDEPTANLDIHAQVDLCTVLRNLAAEGVGVLLVLHDLTLAGTYADRVVLLDGGRAVAHGTPREVLTAEIVARVYGASVTVIAHPETGDPIVVPASKEQTHA